MYEKTLFHSWFYFFGFYLVYSFICLFFFFENNGSGNLAVTSRFKLQKYHNIPRLGRHKSLLVTKDSPSFLSFLLSHCLLVKLLYQSVGSSRSSMFFVLSLSQEESYFLNSFENCSNTFWSQDISSGNISYEEANGLISRRGNR